MNLPTASPESESPSPFTMTPDPREAEASEPTPDDPGAALTLGVAASPPPPTPAAPEKPATFDLLDEGAWLPGRIRSQLAAEVLRRDLTHYDGRRVMPWLALPVASKDWDRYPMLENREGGYVCHPWRRTESIRECRCPACGDKLGRHWAFLLRPDEALVGMTSDPPYHFDCARWLAMERQRWTLPLDTIPESSVNFENRIVEAGGGEREGLTRDALEFFTARLVWNLDRSRVDMNLSGPRLGYELLHKPDIGDIVIWYLHADDEDLGGIEGVLSQAMTWLEDRLAAVDEAVEVYQRTAMGRRVEWLAKLGVSPGTGGGQKVIGE